MFYNSRRITKSFLKEIKDNYLTNEGKKNIEEIYKDTCLGGSGTLERWSWYKTLKVMILRKAKDVENVYLKMLSDPIKTAQMLMNDNTFLRIVFVQETKK